MNATKQHPHGLPWPEADIDGRGLCKTPEIVKLPFDEAPNTNDFTLD